MLEFIFCLTEIKTSILAHGNILGVRALKICKDIQLPLRQGHVRKLNGSDKLGLWTVCERGQWCSYTVKRLYQKDASYKKTELFFLLIRYLCGKRPSLLDNSKLVEL